MNPNQTPEQASNFVDFGGKITEEVFASLPANERKTLMFQAEYFHKLMQRNRLPFFIPNGAQEEFIAAVGNAPASGKKIFISTAANGVGKSSTAVNILGNIIFSIQSKWFDYPLFKNVWQYPKKIWYISEHDAFQNKLVGELRKWLPKGSYSASKMGRKFDSHFMFKDGWVMDLKTFDQDVTQFESDDVGIVLYDEPPPQNIRKACVARLRLGGIEMFVMTPLEHSAWIFDEIIENTEQQKYVDVHYADIESACSIHGKRGILSHDQIQYIASQLDEDEREARLHGKPKHLSGKIYKSLHPSTHRHFIPAYEFTQDKNDIYCVMDIHDRRPPAIVWFATNVDGKKYAIDEYPNDPKNPYHTIKSTNLTYKDFANIIISKERQNGWDPMKVKRFMDPNYGARTMGVLGMTIKDFFAQREFGLYFLTDVNDNLVEGHAAVRNLLAFDLDGRPNLLIGDTLSNTWHQLSRYGIKEFHGKKLESDGMSERVAQKYKDFPDCVRYFAMVGTNPRQKHAPSPAEPRPREADIPRNSNAPWTSDWRNPFPNRTTVTKILR